MLPKKSHEKLCSKCVLPSSYPNVQFDEKGVCNYCNRHSSGQEGVAVKQQTEKIVSLIESSKNHEGHYDALCCYSGGKDSTYMLKQLKEEFDCRILAFTLDNGFLAQEVSGNISRVTALLGVDHIYYRPSEPFLSRLFRAAVSGDLYGTEVLHKTRISDVCQACITLINTEAVRMALRRKIPMVFVGFTAGQIPKPIIRNSYKFYQQTFQSRYKQWCSLLGAEVKTYFEIDEDPRDIYTIAPNFLTNKSESDILYDISSMGWVKPENLDGCTTNCKLNALGNYVHEKRFGFHPYAAELSTLIREHQLTREQALEKMYGSRHLNLVEEMAEMIGVDLTSVKPSTSKG